MALSWTVPLSSGPPNDSGDLQQTDGNFIQQPPKGDVNTEGGAGKTYSRFIQEPKSKKGTSED